MKRIAVGIALGLLFMAGSALAVTITTEQHVVPPSTSVEDQVVTVMVRGKTSVVTYQDTDVWPGTTIVDTDTIPDPVTVTVTVGEPPPPPPPSAPTMPGNLHADLVTTSGFRALWDSSVDPDGIANYRIYLDGLFVGQGCGVHCGWTNAWTFSGLLPATLYRVEVEAVDTLGNVSPRASMMVTTVTPVPPPPPGSGMANLWVAP